MCANEAEEWESCEEMRKLPKLDHEIIDRQSARVKRKAIIPKAVAWEVAKTSLQSDSDAPLVERKWETRNGTHRIEVIGRWLRRDLHLILL